MKYKLFAVVVIFIFTLFSYLFLLDEPLHDDIPKILAEFNHAQPDINNGSIYQLGMWSEISEDPYAIGQWRLSQYKQAEQTTPTSQQEITFIDYPEELQIFELFNREKRPEVFCEIADSTCLTYIYENTAEIRPLLNEYQFFIERYDTLMSYQNFSAYLPPTFYIPLPDFGPSADILQLKLLAIINQAKNENELAAISALVNLLTFQKQILEQSPYMPVKIASTIELDMIIDTIAFLLSKSSNKTSWQILIENLAPFTNSQLTFAKPFFHEFVAQVNALEHIDIASHEDKLPKVINFLPAKILYKKNRTINTLYRWVNNNIGGLKFNNNNQIEVINKAKPEEILRFDYQNPVGSKLLLSMAPKLSNLERFTFQLAVKQQMLRYLYQLPFNKHNQSVYISPFTGKPAYYNEMKFCVSVDQRQHNDICISH